MAVIERPTNEKMSNTRFMGNWRPSTSQLGLGLAALGGLGGLGLVGSKAYKVWDKANAIKEAASAINSNSASPILQMIPI
jgi:hypothetical protein